MAGHQDKLEGKLRLALAKHWHGPLPDPVSTAKSHGIEVQNAADTVDQEPGVCADSSGNVVVRAKREARARGLAVGASVSVALPASSADSPREAVITDITEAGVGVRFVGPGDDESITVDVGDIKPAQKKHRAANSHDDMDHWMDIIKWSPCSTEENAAMLKHVLVSTLYQTYIGRSSLHALLRISWSETRGWAIRPQRDLAPGTLMILPWGNIASEKAKATDLPVALEVDNGSGEPQIGEFWMEARTTPKKVARSAEKATALVPFWLLANAAAISHAQVNAATGKSQAAKSRGPTATSHETRAELVYKAIALPVAQPANAKGKDTVAVKTVCITNDCAVAKGASLYMSTKPPQKLDEAAAIKHGRRGK